jgi:VWFA-related protein
MKHIRLDHLGLVLLLFAGMAVSQQAPNKEATQGQEVIRVVTQEVLLDLVVRDKNGYLIRDLRPEEIEVYDDGNPQRLTSFRLLTGAEAAGIGSKTETAGDKRLDPLRRLRLISLVYEGLDNEARRLAQRASRDFLKDGLEQNVYVAVFVIGDRLHVLQPFTNKLELLRKAADRATSAHYPQFVAESEAIRRQLEAIEREGGAAAEAGTRDLPGRGQSDTSGIAGASTAARMVQVTLNMLNFEESLTRMQQSRSSLFSLLSLVKEQAVLPGRKTVVYFTRGLQVPENMVEQFKSTISVANRAGVSIYGVDSRGLVLDNQNTASASMLNSAVIASQRQQTVDGAPVTPEQVKIFDTAVNSMHANTQQALGDLAGSTGGFLVANTNDLRQGLRQIHEDLLTYYEVTFMPQITEYDGKFHKLIVKINRPGVKVQARNGYFALPPNQDSVFSYEIPLFHSIELSPLPRTIPYQAGAIRFRQQNDKLVYSLVVEVPLRDLTLTEDKEKKHFYTRLSVLALLKDSRGRIVERISRDFPFQVPSDKLEEFQKRQFLYTAQAELAPGRYTLESAVMDWEGRKTSARRVSVMVVPRGEGIGISGISLIRRLDPQSQGLSPTDPFYFLGDRIVPSLENSVKLVPGGGFSFYFIVYPQTADQSKPRLALELSRDGTPLGSISPELPQANERGEIPYIASFPLEKFAPGQYELRAIVRQGSSAAEEKTVFTIYP